MQNNSLLRFIGVFILIILLVDGCSQPPRTLTILHHNDLHAANLAYERTSGSGNSYPVLGIAGLRGIATSIRDTSSASLWLNAGDEYSGGVLSTLTRGASQYSLTEHVGYDVMTLGNHEFDYGREQAEAFRDSAGIPVLGGANLLYPDGTPFAREYLDTTINAINMRIIGLLPPDLKILTQATATGDLQILDPAEAVREHLPSSRRLCIVLSHMGYWEDSLLATQVPEIDLIVGGHSHTVIRTPRLIGPEGRMPDSLITGDGGSRLDGTIVVQAGSSGSHLGYLSLMIKGGDIISCQGELIRNNGETAPPDPELAAYVSEMDAHYAPELDSEIARVTSAMTRAWDEESNFGRWVTDAFKEATNTDIAFQNPGGLRANIGAGPVTLRHFWEACPFPNELVTFDLTGEEVVAIMNHLASGPREGLMISGITATLNTSEHTVENLLINSQPVDPGRTYRAVTNSYVFNHFDTYFGLEQGNRESYQTGSLYRDVLIEAARSQRIVSPPEETRIELVN